MRRLRDLTPDNLLKRVDALAFGIEGVHEMHLEVGAALSRVFELILPVVYLRCRGSARISSEVEICGGHRESQGGIPVPVFYADIIRKLMDKYITSSDAS